MNNQQFRNLLFNTSQKKDVSNVDSPPSSRPSTTPKVAALGSRKHSSIPMTPRQVGRNLSSVNAEFARQLAERNVRANPTKKFKSSVPKGVKLAEGYTDRTQNRVDEDEDERAQRIKKLEESMKLGQIDRDTFEKLVAEITGGDIESTHLVKGLDRKLLEKVRKGDDVRNLVVGGEGGDKSLDVEDEFDELEERVVAPMVREKVEKKGEMAPPKPVAGVKRNRAAILAELKAQRKAAQETAEEERKKKYPSLGAGFTKVGPGGETSRIEIDSKGREVLIITDAEGNEKRKVRKQKPEEPKLEPRFDIENPNKPLHINTESMPKPREEESEDEDIFVGVGSNYNPLANLEDDEDDESSEDSSSEMLAKAAKVEYNQSNEEEEEDDDDEDDEGEVSKLNRDSQDETKSSTTKLRRNYFNTPSITYKETEGADATVRAALAKVRTLDEDSSLLQNTEEARLKKRATELAARDRDMDDLDMGFGESRFDDAEEMEREGDKVKFSEWKGLDAVDDDAEEGHGGRGSKKRRRGPKKKRGDKNSAADVLKVMEKQKGKTLG